MSYDPEVGKQMDAAAVQAEADLRRLLNEYNGENKPVLTASQLFGWQQKWRMTAGYKRMYAICDRLLK